MRKKSVTITTGSEFTWPDKFSGRKITFKVSPIKNGIQIMRGARRGGIRGAEKARGGMLVCTPTRHGGGPRGDETFTHCLRTKDVIIYPGGGAKTRSWSTKAHLHGYSKINRKSRRQRRRSKRY